MAKRTVIKERPKKKARVVLLDWNVEIGPQWDFAPMGLIHIGEHLLDKGLVGGKETKE